MTPTRAAVPHRHRLRTGVVGATLAVAVALAVLPGTPAQARGPRVPSVNKSAAAAQCQLGFGLPKKSDAHQAAMLMAGRADLGKYGWFRLAKNPKWRPVSTLDSSGKGHMHSLHYLLPLLREGVRTGNRAMTARFYDLLKDWAHDNPPKASTRRYAWGPPIYEGFRALVLVCAAAGPRGHQLWLRKALMLHGAMMANPRRYEGINNASLHQSMGLYAIARTMGRNSWRRLAVARERALAARLIEPDGSDEEGAPNYAINNYTWFQQAAERLRRGGNAVPAELLRVRAVPAFIAQATRPDGRIEALGDTAPDRLSRSLWAGTAAEFSATRGASGAPPGRVFSAFRGGYVFGRSGWGSSRPLADETFFSVRAGQARGIPHAHDDAGSVTLYSHGSPLLLDPGVWRYTYGTTRSYVVSRAAHNVVVVDNARRVRPGRPQLSTATVGGIDLATVVDRGYDGVTTTRTVAYDRADDVLLVWDRLEATRQVRASQQWQLDRSRSVTVDADAVHTGGPGANVSMLFTSGGAPLDVAKGQRRPMRGWSSKKYGELAPSPSVRATQSGTSLSWLTVITPRADGVPASAVSATSSVSGTQASVVLSTAAGSARVTLDPTGASRSGPERLVPSVSPAADIVLAGSRTRLNVRGLPPSTPVTLEGLPAGGTGWSATGRTTSSAAGTAHFTVPVNATTDFRVVAEGTYSDARHVTAAVAPTVPVAATAVPTGRGAVRVTWQPPSDSGGAPITGYTVTVNGVRRAVPPTSTNLVVRGVVAGSRGVSVRASNAVASSPLARTRVVVPAWPTVSAPTKARKGSRVTLRLTGLMPRARVTVALSPRRAGAVRHQGPVVASRRGTASVTIVVRRTLRVVVTSDGVHSPPRRIVAVRR